MEIPGSASAPSSGDSKPCPTGSSDDLDIHHDWNPSGGRTTREPSSVHSGSSLRFAVWSGDARSFPIARAADDAALIGAFTLGDGLEEPGSDLHDDFDLNVSMIAPAAPVPFPAPAPAPAPAERRLVLPSRVSTWETS